MTSYGYQFTLPHIQKDHIDGPLLHLSDGSLYWLTLWERFLFALGKHDAFSLQYKHRPDLTVRALQAITDHGYPTS